MYADLLERRKEMAQRVAGATPKNLKKSRKKNCAVNMS
jgi:hypothetical protein